jgi:hypothetical protein
VECDDDQVSDTLRISSQALSVKRGYEVAYLSAVQCELFSTEFRNVFKRDDSNKGHCEEDEKDADAGSTNHSQINA